MIILITGLPGSGKTHFATRLHEYLPDFQVFNGDMVRKEYDDWDFSEEGRFRQALRMHNLASNAENSILDFVCPRETYRKMIRPDITVYISTINLGRFEDTNKIFEPPSHYDFICTNHIDFHFVIPKLWDRVRRLQQATLQQS